MRNFNVMEDSDSDDFDEAAYKTASSEIELDPTDEEQFCDELEEGTFSRIQSIADIEEYSNHATLAAENNVTAQTKAAYERYVIYICKHQYQ